MSSLVVVIAPADLLPALRARTGHDDVAAYIDTDVLQALEAITTRRPSRLVLERSFASTSRGIALVHRLRADPTLNDLEIQVVAVAPEEEPRAAAPSLPDASPPPAAPLDQRGTRRAGRIGIVEGFDILVDGAPVRLVDLSPLGAQVTSGGVLKPNQKVRVSLVDDLGAVRVAATVAWASYELPRPPRREPHYRAGLEFGECDPDLVTAFALRHERLQPA